MDASKSERRKYSYVHMLADGMNLHVDNPKDSTNLVELTNEFGQVARHKINIQKSGVFLHTKMNYPKWILRK